MPINFNYNSLRKSLHDFQGDRDFAWEISELNRIKFKIKVELNEILTYIILLRFIRSIKHVIRYVYTSLKVYGI